MSRIITANELNPDHKDLILKQLCCIKDTVSVCIDRHIDDYDELIGLLAKIVSERYNYTQSELVGSIVEQFEN